MERGSKEQVYTSCIKNFGEDNAFILYFERTLYIICRPLFLSSGRYSNTFIGWKLAIDTFIVCRIKIARFWVQVIYKTWVRNGQILILMIPIRKQSGTLLNIVDSMMEIYRWERDVNWIYVCNIIWCIFYIHRNLIDFQKSCLDSIYYKQHRTSFSRRRTIEIQWFIL